MHSSLAHHAERDGDFVRTPGFAGRFSEHIRSRNCGEREPRGTLKDAWHPPAAIFSCVSRLSWCHILRAGRNEAEIGERGT